MSKCQSVHSGKAPCEFQNGFVIPVNHVNTISQNSIMKWNFRILKHLLKRLFLSKSNPQGFMGCFSSLFKFVGSWKQDVQLLIDHIDRQDHMSVWNGEKILTFSSCNADVNQIFYPGDPFQRDSIFASHTRAKERICPWSSVKGNYAVWKHESVRGMGQLLPRYQRCKGVDPADRGAGPHSKPESLTRAAKQLRPWPYFKDNSAVLSRTTGLSGRTNSLLERKVAPPKVWRLSLEISFLDLHCKAILPLAVFQGQFGGPKARIRAPKMQVFIMHGVCPIVARILVGGDPHSK